jgi:phosphate transport system permease protein
MIARGFGTAAVLLLLVLMLFALARFLGGRGPGQLSARQQRAVIARSARDAVRLARSADLREDALLLSGANDVVQKEKLS